MPAFTIRFGGKASQIVTPVTVMPPFDPNGPPALVPEFKTMALWDTGASKSCISPKVVEALKLAPVGIAKMSHAGGTTDANRHVVNFMLPNRVGCAGLVVTEFATSIGGAFEVIIGMDILVLGDMSLTHVDGKTCMSFRIPSKAEHDFVQEERKAFFAGVGRNDPCPCGKMENGRRLKYKQCHGASKPAQ